MYFICFFFFFQAEDGIRDLTVTGVQTCALPIYRMSAVDAAGHRERPRRPPWPSPRGCPVRAWPGSTLSTRCEHSLASYRHGAGYPRSPGNSASRVTRSNRRVSYVVVVSGSGQHLPDDVRKHVEHDLDRLTDGTPSPRVVSFCHSSASGGSCCD